MAKAERMFTPRHTYSTGKWIVWNLNYMDYYEKSALKFQLKIWQSFEMEICLLRYPLWEKLDIFTPPLEKGGANISRQVLLRIWKLLIDDL